jgi:hypothetical protein
MRIQVRSRSGVRQLAAAFGFPGWGVVFNAPSGAFLARALDAGLHLFLKELAPIGLKSRGRRDLECGSLLPLSSLHVLGT